MKNRAFIATGKTDGYDLVVESTTIVNHCSFMCAHHEAIQACEALPGFSADGPSERGTWCKKIKGILYHFGGWSNPDAAVAKYLRERDYLQAGRTPEPEALPGQVTMVALANEFLDSKQLLVTSGDLSRRMYFDYRKICKQLCDLLGDLRIVENLKPKDFDELRSKFAAGTRRKIVSKVTLANRIRLSRVVFNFAAAHDLIPAPLKYGQNFKQPDATILRAEKNKQPPKKFEASELQSIINAAKPTLKAMILLGINCGFGQTDCATVPRSAFDLEGGWITYPRPKTHVQRRCPLWPETVKALKAAAELRPDARDPANAELMFVTKYGQPFVRINEKGTVIDGVTGGFTRVTTELKLLQLNRGFYSLRRTFETIGGASLDQVAVDFIMGHAPASDDMAAVYCQAIGDDRLEKVANHVRAWLWPKPKRAAKRNSKKVASR